MHWEKTVGVNVRRLRKTLAMSQEALADAAGIDVRYVGGIERGQENPSIAVIGRLAQVLGVHPAVLMDDGTPIKLGT